MAPYAELHAHTAFSLLDGAALPEPLVARAKELGLAALAITDHDELGGIVRFATAAREAELPAIIGAELTVTIAPSRARDEPLVTHLPLLAQSHDGYANLATLVTLARQDVAHRGEPRVTLDQLAAHAGGLFALTGCPRGWVPMLAARDRMVHDVLSCLRHDKTLDTMGTRLRPNAEWYLKSAAQIARRWRGNLDGVRATLAIAEQCTFRLDQLNPTLPAFPLPAGVSPDEYLARLVEQGARERWGEPGTSKRTEEHERQITHELALIAKLGLAGYFLIVWDIVRFARREGILCQGRGSAANSAVCYCLGITAVDPIRLKLLFERFLSEERTEAPDIDIDFAHRERERVLQYVYERYGREHAAMVCEQITYRGKSAVRDAARVLGFSVEQADSLSTLSDRFSAKATADALRATPGDTDAVVAS